LLPNDTPPLPHLNQLVILIFLKISIGIGIDVGTCICSGAMGHGDAWGLQCLGGGFTWG